MLLENSSFPEDSRVLLQARTLTKAGYQVTVIGPTEEGASQKSQMIEDIRVLRYPQPPEWGGVLGYAFEYLYSIGMLWIIACYVLVRYGFDTIHMHTPPDMSAVIPVFFRLFGKKFVYDLHDLSPELFSAQRNGKGNRFIHWMLLKSELFASRNSNLSLSTNESQRDIHVARCGVPREKFHVVRNGPNEAFLTEEISPRQELKKNGCTILGYVGVMGIQDGVDRLIQALNVLVHKHQRKDVHLVLVGSGAALADLKSQAASFELTEFTTFVGRVPFSEVPAYIAAFDICCTPDPSNPYNDSCTTIKTMEYMALGKPVVCFETIENMKTAGRAALYAKNNDVVVYAEQIETLMNDAALREQMGKWGRERIIEHLAWKHQARVLVSAYDGLHRLSRAEQCHETAMVEHAPSPRVEGLDVRFAFNGAIGQILAKHYHIDCRCAILSSKFRLYYRLRPFLPQRIRQLLQKKRNSSLPTTDDWYIQSDFFKELKAASQPTPQDAGSGQSAISHEERVIHPWPDGHQYAVALTHDIETAEGMKRVSEIAHMEESMGLRSAWFFVPHKYKLDLGLVQDLKARGHEVGIHGYNHDGRLFVSRSIFNHRARYINHAGDQFSASGFRAPMMHRNYNWMQALEFDYDASCFDIDPYQPMPGGVAGVWPFIAGKLVELPYTLPQDHTLMITLGQSASQVWIRKMEVVAKLAGLVMLITHPDYLDSLERREEYRRFCEHVSSANGKWLALPREVAQWWRIRQESQIGQDGNVIGPASERGRVQALNCLFDFS